MPSDAGGCCAAGTLALDDGSCQPAGVPPSGCGEGFAHDGDAGCEPMLPNEPCPPGQMAVPGDAICRPVMECAPGPWGDIPIASDTQHVDGSFTGDDADGSAAKPWRSITAAVAAAASGAIVAIAEGSYLEDVVVAGKSLRLWGVCPGKVEIVGTGGELATVFIRAFASGTEVRGLAIRGPTVGLLVSGSEGVVVDGLWIHDAAGRGINVENTLGTTSLTVAGSLIEDNNDIGLRVIGSAVTVAGSVIRGTSPRTADQRYGRGISAEACGANNGCDPAVPADLTVRRSVLEANHETGLLLAGSSGSVDSTVVRGTLPDATSQNFGRGIAVQPSCAVGTCDDTLRASIAISGSLLADNRESGISVTGSDAVIEGSVVRGTLAPPLGNLDGVGVSIQSCADAHGCDPDVRSNVTARGLLIEDSHGVGVFVAGSDATIEAVVVRATQARPDGSRGYGLDAAAGCFLGGQCDGAPRANVVVRGSLFDNNHTHGIGISGSDGIVEGTVVRDTLPQPVDQNAGRGINVQLQCSSGMCDGGGAATITVRGSLVANSHEAGIVIIGSQATLETTVVSTTLPRPLDGTNGDGVAVVTDGAPASATITRSRIEDSARAGVSSFGGEVAIDANVFECNTFDLDGESEFAGLMVPFTFSNLGGNTCGCKAEAFNCKVVSSLLEPPRPSGAGRDRAW